MMYPFIFGGERGMLPCFASPLCLATVRRAHSTRLRTNFAKNMPLAYFLYARCPLRVRILTHKKTETPLKGHPCFLGGERGIRTLERIPPLHDFQSCAFDQLSHLSASLHLGIIAHFILQCKSYFIKKTMIFELIIPLDNDMSVWYNFFINNLHKGVFLNDKN